MGIVKIFIAYDNCFMYGLFGKYNYILQMSNYFFVSECNFGTFGTDCINNCSTHCFENSTCNRKTGKCDMGCSPGYNDEKCSKSKFNH